MLTHIVVATVISTPAAPTENHARIEQSIRRGDVKSLFALRQDLNQGATSGDGAEPSSLYLLGYVDWRINQLLRPKVEAKPERERILNEARSALERMVAAQPSNGEAQVLLATVLGELIAGDPDRAVTYGPRSGQLMAKAVASAPDSPRVALLRGIWYLFMPAMYGGGLDEAEKELDRALRLFKREAATAPWPNWGRMDAYAWRGQVAAKKGEKAKAKAIYQKALAEMPDAAWIETVLLPEVL